MHPKVLNHSSHINIFLKLTGWYLSNHLELKITHLKNMIWKVRTRWALCWHLNSLNNSMVSTSPRCHLLTFQHSVKVWGRDQSTLDQRLSIDRFWKQTRPPLWLSMVVNRQPTVSNCLKPHVDSLPSHEGHLDLTVPPPLMSPRVFDILVLWICSYYITLVIFNVYFNNKLLFV